MRMNGQMISEQSQAHILYLIWKICPAQEKNLTSSTDEKHVTSIEKHKVIEHPELSSLSL